MEEATELNINAKNPYQDGIV